MMSYVTELAVDVWNQLHTSDDLMGTHNESGCFFLRYDKDDYNLSGLHVFRDRQGRVAYADGNGFLPPTGSCLVLHARVSHRILPPNDTTAVFLEEIKVLYNAGKK